MSQYMFGLNDTLDNACRSAMLNNEMYIACLMTHMEEIEGQNMKIVRAREFKKAHFEGGFNKNGRFNQGGGQRANVPFQGKGKQKVDNNQGVPSCAKCGKNHKSECLLGSNVCYRCGKPGHQIRDCRVKDENLQVQGAPKGQVAPNAQGGQAQAKGGRAPRNNRFYALHGRQEDEETPDVVTDMLQVFNFDVYALLDPGVNLQFVSPMLL